MCDICNLSQCHPKHERSYLHLNREFEVLRCVKTRDLQEWRSNQEDISELKYTLTCKDYNCKNCDFKTTSIKDMYNHEIDCYGDRVEERDEYKYPYITCGDCGKKFFNKGQKLKPEYARQNHYKVCANQMIKKKKAILIEEIKSGKPSLIDQMFDLINNKQN